MITKSLFKVAPAVPGSSCNHQTLVVGLDSSFEADGDGVRILMSAGFGHAVIIALDCIALEKILQAWPVPDVCDELPF